MSTRHINVQDRTSSYFINTFNHVSLRNSCFGGNVLIGWKMFYLFDFWMPGDNLTNVNFELERVRLSLSRVLGFNRC